MLPDNGRPIANAGPDQARFVGETVALDGGGSSDPDGDPLAFRWTMMTVPPGSLAVLTVDAYKGKRRN